MGASNGLFESSDTGQTWNNILRRIDTVSTFCIALTAKGNDLFAAPDAGGVFHSTDVGQSWFRVDSGFPYDSKYDHLWFLSSSNGVLFGGDYSGYDYRSTNNGSTWDSIPSITPNDGVYLSPNHSTVFAWYSEGGIRAVSLESTDTGATWSKFTIDGNILNTVTTNGNFALAQAEGVTYYSINGGTSWSATSGLPGSPSGIFSFSPNILIAGSEATYPEGGTYRSTNSGSTWLSFNPDFYPYNPYGQTFLQLGKDLFSLGYNTISSQSIFVSSDSGSSWNDVAAVQLPLDIHSLSVIGSKIISGTGGYGASVTSNDGSNWNQSGLTNRTVYSLLSTSNFLFAGTDAADTSGGIFRSSDTGTTWTRMVNGISNVNAIASPGNNIFAGTDSGIYLSSNAGTNWSPVFSHVHVNALAAQGSKVFAGTSANGLITSTNNGTSWSANNGTLPITDVQSLAVKGGILFAGTNGNGLFLSTDTGQSWTDVSSGLPASSVLSLEENSQQFFAGTAGDGIFRTDDSGKTWKQVDSGLVNLNVTSLGIRNGNLFAGTIGGGVWERPLSQMLFVEPASVTQSSPTSSEIHTYPNPLSQSTQITFTLPEVSEVTLTISDAAGRETPLLRSAWFPAGQHEIAWDASNYPSGVYLCRLSSGGESVTERVVVLK